MAGPTPRETDQKTLRELYTLMNRGERVVINNADLQRFEQMAAEDKFGIIHEPYMPGKLEVRRKYLSDEVAEGYHPVTGEKMHSPKKMSQIQKYSHAGLSPEMREDVLRAISDSVLTVNSVSFPGGGKPLRAELLILSAGRISEAMTIVNGVLEIERIACKEVDDKFVVCLPREILLQDTEHGLPEGSYVRIKHSGGQYIVAQVTAHDTVPGYTIVMYPSGHEQRHSDDELIPLTGISADAEQALAYLFECVGKDVKKLNEFNDDLDRLEELHNSANSEHDDGAALCQLGEKIAAMQVKYR